MPLLDVCKAVTYTARISNEDNGEGAATFDVAINLGLGHNSSPRTTENYNPFWATDYRSTRHFSNFRFGSNPAFTPFDLPSTVYPTYGSGTTSGIPADFFTSDPDGPGQGFEDLDKDGFYDDLPAGASTEISFDVNITPRENCGTGRYDYMAWEHIYFDVYGKNQCKQVLDTERVDFNYTNLIRDYHAQTLIDMPTDVGNGENFDVAIKFNATSSIACDGKSMFSNDPSTIFTATLTLPPGYDLQPGAPAEFAQTGNTITFTTHELSNFFAIDWVRFPLVLNCAGSGGDQSIQLTSNLKCIDSGGDTCFDQDIHCKDLNIKAHCPGPCSGPTISNFQARRTTAGWTDTSMTTKVDLTDETAGYAVKNYMPGDIMRIKTGSILNNFTTDNLFFEIDYATETNGGDETIIGFEGGTITIVDLDGPTRTSPIDPAHLTVTTDGSGNHKATFDLSSYKNSIASAYSYGEDLENDEVSLELDFRISKEFNLYNLFEFEELRGRFYAYSDYPINSIKIACDDWGDRASYGQQRFRSSNRSHNFTSCNKVGLQGFFTQDMDVGNLFPNEYRPASQFVSAQYTLPDGLKFAGEVTSVGLYGSYSTSSGHLIAKESNGVVTITPGPNYINMSQSGTRWARFYLQVYGSCELESTTTVPYTYNYINYYYADSDFHEAESLNANLSVNYTEPTFSFQSPKPIVNGDSFMTDFDFELSNTGSITIDYNWFEVDLPTGLTTEDVFVINGTTETPIN
ncbi:MAG: hypothetical protein AB3N16_05750, partial [Flavobacteriaceae bacterium]